MECFVRHAESHRLFRADHVRELRGRHLVKTADGTVCATQHVRLLPPAPIIKGRVLPRTGGVVVQPLLFTGPFSHGDFRRWLADPTLRHETMLIFNDNLEDNDHPYYYAAGGGNACVRPLRETGDAMGIPTGSYATWTPFSTPGFQSLAQPLSGGRTVKECIDAQVERIRAHLAANPQKRVVHYSADPLDGHTIGCGIFLVDDQVRRYITDRIWSLASS